MARPRIADRPNRYDPERPWLRQPCDTESRWRAFQAYRDQPRPRTVRGASEALDGFDVRTLEAWSSQDAWPERCAEFDRWLDERRIEVIVDVLKEDARAVANRHASIARDAIECAHSVVRGWLVDLAQGKALDDWSPAEVRGMLKDMITLERLVRGEATERVEHEHGFDLARLSVPELEELRRLEAKASAGVVD